MLLPVMLRLTSQSMRRRAVFSPLERQICTAPQGGIASAVKNNFLLGRRPQAQRSPKHFPPSPPMRFSYSTEETIPKPENEEEDALALLETFSADVSSLGPAPDEKSCLQVSYTIIYEVMRYLARHGEGSESYLSIFMNSEAPENSNIGRARKSIFQLTKHLVRLLSSVSSLRVSQPVILGLVGALEPYITVYDGEGDAQGWKTFWSQAQPVLLELGAQLSEEVVQTHD
ncbi:hypothetical protein C8F04DRAFT_1086658 [Mycena alexandri]|uniref:Uncharacterized protein n=1 Tax=Mycena alexandri TaxID=1745969 RepID=A0AAD6T408_9AGAR|nr:hypothetical protein C8F04DRAFT_1086658 [Mycena alexandri]